MARSKTFANNIEIARALRAYEGKSRFLKIQLMDMGYLEQVKVPEAKKVIGSRGRMPIHYELTGKGRGLLGMSKNWAAFKVAATEAVNDAVDAVTTAVNGGEQTEQVQSDTATA